MSGISQLGYLGFQVRSLAAWEEFATEVLGLTVVNRQKNGGFSLRNDGHQNRFFISPGPADDLAFVGLQLDDEDAFNAAIERIRSKGVEVWESTRQEREARQVKGLAILNDPAGQQLELHWGPMMAETPFESELVPNGFVADELGLGHCVLRANDMEESQRFYFDVMGFRLSDHVITKIGPYEVNIAFTHMNPRHHSIAIGGNLPKKIHHFLLQAKTLDEVGACFDRVTDAKIRVSQTLGRHPNDKMVSFYAHTPSGFEFEFGFGAIEVDDDSWTPSVHKRISEWGHRRPPYARPKD